MRNYKKSLAIAVLAMAALPILVLGAPESGGKTPPPSPLTSIELPNPLLKGTTIEMVFSKILAALRVVIPSIAAGVIIYAAFQILTAGGDTGKFATAKKTIGYAVAGLALFLVADLIVGVITEFLGKK
ncbi:MAG: Uncharacterized protein G01um101419_436 [Parcubacteria group bacterium Gr01-1014_19]|nr:MAG: Uncharacterized protein G01um101419_436 [Parcubacteria group bacterium Gr01-1014_19]